MIISSKLSKLKLFSSRKNFFFYFHYSNYILNKSPGMGYISTMEWPLVLCLLGTWILVYVCLCRGVKLSGKVRKEKPMNLFIYIIMK